MDFAEERAGYIADTKTPIMGRRTLIGPEDRYTNTVPILVFQGTFVKAIVL